MGLSTKERDERLRAIAETCYIKPVPFPTLKAAVCRKWSVTPKTAEDYIVGLIEGKILEHDPPGGPLHVTVLGERWLDGLPAPDGPVIPDPPDVEIAEPRKRLPSPPPTSEGQG
jgi:hypothetical protein